jgi:hypothetical protein
VYRGHFQSKHQNHYQQGYIQVTVLGSLLTMCLHTVRDMDKGRQIKNRIMEGKWKCWHKVTRAKNSVIHRTIQIYQTDYNLKMIWSEFCKENVCTVMRRTWKRPCWRKTGGPELSATPFLPRGICWIDKRKPSIVSTCAQAKLISYKKRMNILNKIISWGMFCQFVFFLPNSLCLLLDKLYSRNVT